LTGKATEPEWNGYLLIVRMLVWRSFRAELTLRLTTGLASV